MSIIFVFAILLIGVAVLVVSMMGIYLWVSSGFQKYAPPVRSSGKLKDAVLADIEKVLNEQPDGQLVVDLGSGWGTLLLPLSKKFPKHRFVGVERAFSPYWFSRFRARKVDNLTFVRGDLYQYDIAKADVVTLFLIGFMMPEVTKKCVNELKKGAKVFVSRFPMVDVKPVQTVSLGNKMETYFVYEF